MPSQRSSASSGRSVNELNTRYINCDCQLRCMLLISYTNENFGRLFYKCNSCGFFEWWDAVNTPNDSTNDIVNTQAGRSTAAANTIRTLLNMVKNNGQTLEHVKSTLRALYNKVDAVEAAHNYADQGVADLKSQMSHLVIAIYVLIGLVGIGLLK